MTKDFDWRERAQAAEWRLLIMYLMLREASVQSFAARAQAIASHDIVSAMSADMYWFLDRETNK